MVLRRLGESPPLGAARSDRRPVRDVDVFVGANPCHLVMFRALAERLAMARAPVPPELVEDLENDFPRLMEQRRGLIRDDAATVGP